MINLLSKTNSIDPGKRKIVFFDNNCLLCNRTVLFLLKRDKYTVLQFAPIGGETFDFHNLKINSKNENSVIFLNNGKISLRSTAILKILYQLPFPWKLAIVFTIVPASIRDFAYRYIAKNRMKFFGKNNMCIANEARYAESLLK